jgi:hypothetical protein
MNPAQKKVDDSAVCRAASTICLSHFIFHVGRDILLRIVGILAQNEQNEKNEMTKRGR